ncbi:MAG: phage tail assembly chaperone [Rhizobiales bacterium]|nr:phage tail assembly chaperone [Hyphomicrobiales bacterium]
MDAAAFPWTQAIGFGIGVLHLSPDAFWRMTPRELAAAVQALGGGVAPFARCDLDALLRRFPDTHSSSSQQGGPRHGN